MIRSIVGCVLTVSLLLPMSAVTAASPEEDLRLQLVAIAEYLQNAYGLYPELTDADLRQVILDGVAWTLAAQEDSGHFGYEYAPFTGEYVEGDGMVRQAGTLFMLSEVYKHQQHKDPVIATAIEKAIEYFASVSAEVTEDGKEFWCIKNSPRSDRCDLGSSSLALIGILNYVAADPAEEPVYREHIKQYSTYLQLAKFPSAGFSSRYDVEDGFGKDESPFYNGEAMLALVKYYQYQEDEAVRTMIEEVFVHLSSQEYESPLYLWIMAALKDMQRLWPNDAYVAYAADFTKVRLANATLRRNTTHNYCAPLEGLVSAYSILEGDVQLSAPLYREIDFWLGKTTYLQLQSASPYRLVQRDGQLQLLRQLEPAVAHGGFLTDEAVLTQRIDFTQHCISAYLQKLVDVDGGEL